MKRLLLLCSAMLMLAACTQENDFGNKPTYKVDYSGVEVTESTLSVEQAMNNMNFVYRNFEGKEHKIRKIRKVEMLTTGNLRPTSLTRSGLGEDAEDQPLAYVVNFEEEAGYAILAADAQLPPIIMLGDEGNFSTQNYLEFLQRTETRSGDSDFDPSNVQDLQYAIVTNSLILPGGDHTFNPEAGCMDTTILVKCWPLVKTKWGQYAPYNHYAPLEEGCGNKSVAGCVPVAVAQILASVAYHHNYRTAYSATDAAGTTYSADWITLSKIIDADTVKYYSSQLTPGALKVAELIRAVGVSVDATYRCYDHNGTSSNINQAANLFSSLNLAESVSIIDFSKEDARSMIVNDLRPVYTRASSGGDYGHAFIMDGWMTMEYTKQVITPPMTSPTIDLKHYQFDLVHVNFGWDGRCDGYYIPRQFDTSQIKFDEWADENDIPSVSYDYNYNLSIQQIKLQN